MIVDNLRNFLSQNNLDYLLINSTDEFLSEYNELSNNSRYFVTGFSGSTGDALLARDELFQFVDGRYHEQADCEVDPKTVKVVKLQMGESFSDKLVEQVKEGSAVGIVSKKISLNLYKILKKKFASKFVKIVDLDEDPVAKFVSLKSSDNGEAAKKIDIKISGLSADEKFKKLSKKLRKREIYLETNPENIAYFTNLRQYKTPFSSTFSAKMTICKDKAIVFTNEKTEAIGEFFEVKPLDDFKNFIPAKPSKFEVLYSSDSLNYADYKLIKRHSIESRKNRISEMKAIKNESEIAHFKKNFERTDNVISKIRKMVEDANALSEAELSGAVEVEYLNQGAKQLSFSTILAAGPNSSIIHYSHPSKNVRVKDRDFVLLDCGGHFEGGYSTDITRVFLKGDAQPLQKRVYTTVLKMFLNAYHYKVTSRTTGHSLDRVARKIAQKSGLLALGFNFNHGLGHGVGINVHESPPSISSGKSGKKFLKENMVFTIEPGLYCKDFGGVRLENTVYLTKKEGVLVIESFSKSGFEEKCVDLTLLTEKEKEWFALWQKRGANA